VPLPVLVYVDAERGLLVHDVSPSVAVVYGRPVASLGAARAAAVQAARDRFGLGLKSAIVVLDDDDFYSSRHFEATLAALDRAPGGWTGSLAIGLTCDGGPIEFVRNESGVGQHATWAYTLARYDAGGGYPDIAKDEDLGLGYGMKWRECTPHWYCTHVRRQTTIASISGLGFDRAKLRSMVKSRRNIGPLWTKELRDLDRWCAARYAPPLTSQLQR
jgi:hypothetical protein